MVRGEFMLVDHQIKAMVRSGDITLSPYDESMVQPASVDLRLGADFIRYEPGGDPLDPASPSALGVIGFSSEEVVLYPGEFILGATLERVGLGPGVAARIEGKSTLGRLGLIVHSTAGFIDPGFEGDITLEMANMNVRPIVLRSCMSICQVAFYRMESAAERPYGHASLGSRYQGQTGATAPRASKLSLSFR